MKPHILTSPPHVGIANLDRPLLWLVLAALLLLVALRFVKSALAPVGAIVQALAAAAVVTLSVALALVLVVVAMFTGT